MKFLALLAIVGLTMAGCSTVNQIPDTDFAAGIKVVSYNSAYWGFKAVLNNNAATRAQLCADATTATGIIRTNVLPVFSGASTGEVLRSAVDTALTQLSASSMVADIINVALVVAEGQIHLPDNPADKLDNRTKLALLAFFNGVADGLDQAVKDVPPPPPPTARAVPPTPTKLKWVNR